MTDEMKLLTALTEALGFEIEVVRTKTLGHARDLTYSEREFGGTRPLMEFQGDGLYKEVTMHVDYKVTRKIAPPLFTAKTGYDGPIKPGSMTPGTWVSYQPGCTCLNDIVSIKGDDNENL